MSAFSLSYSNDELRLYQAGVSGVLYAQVALPAGLVRMGRINNPDSFAKVVMEAMQSGQPHTIKADRVIIGLPEEQAFVKLITLPGKLSASELRSTIEYQWETVLPIPVDQVYYDCCYLKTTNPKEKIQCPVLVVAYPKEIVTTLLVVLRQLNLIPVLFIPTSFGYARLFSPPQGEAVTLVDSVTGNDVTVAIVKDNLTLFSTTIHASVDDAKLAKQVDNLREFYSRTTNQKAGTLSRALILPGHYASNLGQSLAGIGLSFETAKLPAPFDGNAVLVPFLGLAGLLKDHYHLSILPPELQDEQRVRHQRAFLRTTSLTMLAVTTLLIYFSITFILSLRLIAASKTHYSQNVADRISAESKKTGQNVVAINQLIDRLTPLASKRSHISSIVASSYKSAVDSSISIEKIASSDGKTVTIEALGANQTTISQFITSLKSVPTVADIKQELTTSPTLSDKISFRLTITTKDAT